LGNGCKKPIKGTTSHGKFKIKDFRFGNVNFVKTGTPQATAAIALTAVTVDTRTAVNRAITCRQRKKHKPLIAGLPFYNHILHPAQPSTVIYLSFTTAAPLPPRIYTAPHPDLGAETQREGETHVPRLAFPLKASSAVRKNVRRTLKSVARAFVESQKHRARIEIDRYHRVRAVTSAIASRPACSLDKRCRGNDDHTLS
jgi:hypothetical protein